jgi:hypothetical protein
MKEIEHASRRMVKLARMVRGTTGSVDDEREVGEELADDDEEGEDEVVSCGGVI